MDEGVASTDIGSPAAKKLHLFPRAVLFKRSVQAHDLSSYLRARVSGKNVISFIENRHREGAEAGIQSTGRDVGKKGRPEYNENGHFYFG